MSDDEIPKKTIRSFVKRSGRISDNRKQAMDELWPQFGIEVTEELNDVQNSFIAVQPLVIEIGFGMGHSLLAHARENPQLNYVGIEVHDAGVARVLAEIPREEINNLRIIHFDAVEVLTKHIENGSVNRVQIYFPDPWHKKRHNKRRLIQAEFVSLLASKLKTGGNLHLATDWQEYAEQMLEVCNAELALNNLSGSKDYVPNENLRPETKFERRGVKLGHGVWDLLYEKV